jgi:hypothetical protein
MKTMMKITIIIIASIFLIWIVATIWTQVEGPGRIRHFGSTVAIKKALIIYDPDPFYNFDEQICETFARTLSDNNWYATVATVKSARKMDISSFDLYVLCANTYNWDPDWSIDRFIMRNGSLYKKKVVAITLGAGSTERSQETLETLIKGKGSILIDSKSFWLYKPNDESRLNESNVKVANELVKKWVIDLNETNKLYSWNTIISKPQ